ncbi:hypothetical protein HPB50_018430 [Hyalomma asiaticum]|uniref:Uncharacterized protein n=1 Tax=Hyalomma asiaticum TaxID=266040 RepID=A0ACB7T7T4_HYAAI|nr:hypothetical protein HPB50_018430 [Hyalomma asiaticum]
MRSMSQLEVLCDRVALMETGKIEALGDDLQIDQNCGHCYHVPFKLPYSKRNSVSLINRIYFAMMEFHQCEFTYNYKVFVATTWTPGSIWLRLLAQYRGAVIVGPSMALVEIYPPEPGPVTESETWARCEPDTKFPLPGPALSDENPRYHATRCTSSKDDADNIAANSSSMGHQLYHLVIRAKVTTTVQPAKPTQVMPRNEEQVMLPHKKHQLIRTMVRAKVTTTVQPAKPTQVMPRNEEQVMLPHKKHQLIRTMVREIPENGIIGVSSKPSRKDQLFEGRMCNEAGHQTIYDASSGLRLLTRAICNVNVSDIRFEVVINPLFASWAGEYQDRGM